MARLHLGSNTDMAITLYTAPGSVGLALHIALEEINESRQLDYDVVLLDMQNTEHRGAAYKTINPKARVPSLIVDGTVLTETPAILVYLAQIAPESSLALPEDPIEFANIQSFNSYLCSTVHIAHAHKYRGNRWVKDETALAALTANVPTTMTECCTSLEEHFITGPWVMGDEFSICDPYLFAMASWFESDGVNINQFPKIENHLQTMLARKSVVAAMQQLQT